MKNLLSFVTKTFFDLGVPRSGGWSTVRKHHLEKEGWCRICGGIDELQVHHKIPFHFNPTLELNEGNLITLCEKLGKDCHLKYGHLGSWKQYNPEISEIAVSPKIGISISNYDNKIPNIQPIKNKI